MATENVEDVKVLSSPAPIDEKAVRLADLESAAITHSAEAECDIAASETLIMYVKAGRAHVDSILCGKASIDHRCTVRGVATTWTPAYYDTIIDAITTRVRAVSPESFSNFDALKERTPNAVRDRERLQSRILVSLVADALVSLIGDKVWDLPYRLVANYLITEKVYQFSKATVEGSLRKEHAEFLKTNLTMVADKTCSSASFLNGLKAHFEGIEKADEERVDAHLTPHERTQKKAAQKAAEKASEREKKTSTIRKNFVESLGASLAGNIAPTEIAQMITDAAKSANVSLPFGQKKVETMTPADLRLFLESVVKRGGATADDRRKMIGMIVAMGSELDRARRNKAALLIAAKQAAELAEQDDNDEEPSEVGELAMAG